MASVVVGSCWAWDASEVGPVNQLVEQAHFEGSFLAFTPEGQGLVTSVYRNGHQTCLYDLAGTEQGRFNGVIVDCPSDGQGLLTYAFSDGQSRFYNLAGTEQSRFEGWFRSYTPDGQGFLTFSDSDGNYSPL